MLATLKSLYLCAPGSLESGTVRDRAIQTLKRKRVNAIYRIFHVPNVSLDEFEDEFY